MVREMIKVLVIPCDIQLPACFSVLEVESTCLCFVRICTQVIPFIILGQILQCFSEDGFCLLKSAMLCGYTQVVSIDEVVCLIVYMRVVCIDIE